MKPMGPSIECSISIKGDPKERLVFESFPANSMKEGYTADWHVIKVGRTSVATSVRYTGGDESDIPIDLTFVAGAFRGRRAVVDKFDKQSMIELDSALQEMESKVMFLKALHFPRPKTPKTIEQRNARKPSGDPPKVIFTLGRFRTYEGVLQRFDVDWKPPYHPTSGRPYTASVSLSLQILHEFYPDWYDIRGIPLKKTPPSLSATTNATEITEGIGAGVRIYSGIDIKIRLCTQAKEKLILAYGLPRTLFLTAMSEDIR